MDTRACVSCGNLFVWEPRKGLHHPKDCHEGLDLDCPACDPDAYTKECRTCRPKQAEQQS